MSKNDIAWETLFSELPILYEVKEKGFFEINSTRINQVRQARLMTKFDHRSQLPEIFAQNNLSILPTSRGNYIISNIETFFDFEEDNSELIEVPFPSYIKSLDFNNITSEAIALNCAFISDMITNFVEDENLKLTVNGRMSSLGFDFNISKRNKTLLPISVNNAQIEIDGGYEGHQYLTLIEAKNSISKDFMIRQLYYPYRLWKGKLEKEIKNIFLTYSNGIFHFREYRFEDPNHFNSLQLVKSKRYSIRNSRINMEVIQKILTEVEIVPELKIPFPQADSFERFINLCELLNSKTILSREKITQEYDFNVRQTNYYTSVGMYFDLIGKTKIENQVNYFLTEKGKNLFKISLSKRQLKFIELILSHKAFNETLKLYIQKGENPNKSEIVQIMKQSNLYNIHSHSTFHRRASTILSWINWILDQIEE